MVNALECNEKINNMHDEEYTIIKLIGRGANTMTYLAEYNSVKGMQSKCIVKEYCPASVQMFREANGSLSCSAQFVEKYEDGKKRFKEGGYRENELRNVQGLSNLVPEIRGCFEQNNTVYLDVIHHEGVTYNQLIDEPLLNKMRICLSIAKLVDRFHKAGYLCLDIKPDNFMVLDTTALSEDVVNYIDFDSLCKKGKFSFGKALSCTKAWSAPEQRNPYLFKKISEATDIYALGELIFWTVFNRHSEISEHRMFAEYVFDEILNAPECLSRRKVRNLLSQIFAHSLCSVPERRYQSVDKLINVLSELIEEIEKKVYFKERIIRPKRFFQGRQRELGQIHEILDADGILFVQGMGGIGKSEIVRQYCSLNREKYDNILYVNYLDSLVHAICDEIDIVGIVREYNESDIQFCWRKVALLNQVLSGTSIFVIDNFDIMVSEMDVEEQKLWNYIKKMSLKLLITTRNHQNEYPELFIDSIQDKDNLRMFFMREKCVYEEGYIRAIDDIIEMVKRHTLLMELISRQMSASKISSMEMLTMLQSTGICGLPQDAIGFEKDFINSDVTVMEHLRKLFSMTNISEQQKIILVKLAFMPVAGISANLFSGFFSLQNYNDINVLINKGWICQSNDDDFILTVHPIIASLAASLLIDDKKIHEEFLHDISMASKCVEEAGTSFYGEIVELYRSVAYNLKRYGIKSNKVADYITEYVAWSNQYGNVEARLELLQYAIDIYNTLYKKGAFYQYREWAYDMYVTICIEQNTGKKEEIEAVCKERHKAMFLQCEFSWAVLWLVNACKSMVERSGSATVKYLFNNCWKILLYSEREITVNATPFLIRDAELLEMMLIAHAEESTPMVKKLYQIALLERRVSLKRWAKRQKNVKTNAFEEQTQMSEARLYLLSDEQTKAREVLQGIVNGSGKEYVTVNQYTAHKMLADISILAEDYQQAKIDLEKCQEIADKLILPIDRELLYCMKKVYSALADEERLYTVENIISILSCN